MSDEIEENFRHYTVTIKPALPFIKGNLKSLKDAVYNFICCTGTTDYKCEYEKLNTNNVHAHLLIVCPYIRSKYYISKLLNGYHVHTNIIPLSVDAQGIIDIWLKYITKEKSTSHQYHELYGNMFSDD